MAEKRTAKSTCLFICLFFCWYYLRSEAAGVHYDNVIACHTQFRARGYGWVGGGLRWVRNQYPHRKLSPHNFSRTLTSDNVGGNNFGLRSDTDLTAKSIWKVRSSEETLDGFILKVMLAFSPKHVFLSNTSTNNDEVRLYRALWLPPAWYLHLDTREGSFFPSRIIREVTRQESIMLFRRVLKKALKLMSDINFIFFKHNEDFETRDTCD